MQILNTCFKESRSCDKLTFSEQAYRKEPGSIPGRSTVNLHWTRYRCDRIHHRPNQQGLEQQTHLRHQAPTAYRSTFRHALLCPHPEETLQEMKSTPEYTSILSTPKSHEPSHTSRWAACSSGHSLSNIVIRGFISSCDLNNTNRHTE
jgi:hypothetical protein